MPSCRFRAARASALAVLVVARVTLAATDWTINEIHADPHAAEGDANGDGRVDTSEDEFVEIVNRTGGDADIARWTVADSTGVRHAFPIGTVVPDECAVVVFGGGSIGLRFRGAVMQRASAGALGLDNRGDTVTLRDSSGRVLAEVSYGPEGGDDQSLTLEPDLAGDVRVKHAEAAGSDGRRFSPGTRSNGISFGGCPDEPPPEVVVEIWEIQEDGASSPFAGRRVATSGNVVTAVAPDGFFVQTPPERSDEEPETSDGLFVYTGGAPGVTRGDVVDIGGEVSEFFELTEITRPERLTVTGRRGAPPDPVPLDETMPSPDASRAQRELERLEGMLVAFSGTVTGPYNRFGELLARAGGGRAFREPGIVHPGLPGLPVWDGNPEVFEVEPDLLGLPDAPLPAGAVIEECIGPLTFRFGAYTVLPLVFTAGGKAAARPVRERGEGELTIATYNLLSLFDDADDPGDDDVVPAGEYARRLAKHSRFIRDVLRSPDILAVQEVEKVEVLGALAARIAADDRRVEYAAFLEPGNHLGARNVGFLVRRRDGIEGAAVEQIGRGETLPGGEPTFSRPPLVLRASTAGERPFEITIVNVHLRSLIGIDDPGGEGNRVRDKRYAQTTWLAREVQRLQTDDPSRHLVVLGDFNAFEFTDGYVDVMGIVTGTVDPDGALLDGEDLVEPDLRNRTLDLAPAERYTMVYDGASQALDHILTSSTLDAFVRGIEVGRGNADAPWPEIEDPGSPLRASDHDAPVLFLEPPVSVFASFRRGDANRDGRVDLADASRALEWLFLGGSVPPCPDAADSNDDGRLALSDAVSLLDFLFLGGVPLPPPGTASCGVDPSDDGLGRCDGRDGACR